MTILPTWSRGALAALVACCSLALPAASLAQPAGALPEVQGRTVEGQPFNLSMLKGKVVLVMFWSTGCAVCRDKMPELRQNVEGWRGKPFELVLISTDRKMSDIEDYEKIISRTVPIKQRFVQLWAGEAGYKDNLGKPPQLPMAYLLDKNGKVTERWQGRIPAEAWDKIADLM